MIEIENEPGPLMKLFGVFLGLYFASPHTFHIAEEKKTAAAATEESEAQ